MYPELEFAGRVDSISVFAREEGRRGRLFNVFVSFDEGAEREIMKPGMSARIEVITFEKKSTLFVPRECVGRDEKDSFVLVSRGTGLEKVYVETGRVNERYCEIIGGLEEGQVLSGVSGS